MRHCLTGSVAMIGLIGLFLAGLGETSASAQDDYRYIPNDHRPLRFKNDDKTLYFKSNARPRYVRQRPTSEPIHQHSQGTLSTERPTESHNLAEASVEKEALICPVTGDKIASVKDAVGQSIYKGKTYYFCCEGCKPRFDKTPATYVNNAKMGKYEKM